jgi:hypothetical protein
MAADDDIISKLRDARPSYQDGRGLRGNSANSNSELAARLPATAPRHQFQTTATAPSAPFPSLPAAAAGDEGVPGPPSANANEYSFELELDSIDVDAYTIDIHVGYGEINDAPPDGMTGADDYIFTIPGAADGTEFYAVITYDTDTLSITSRTLGFADSVPDSTLGILYVPIGFVDITYGDAGKITEVNPHNRYCGDINLQLSYGVFNGAPALFPMPILGIPQPLV